MTHFEYILEQAATLIVNGDATPESAFLLAIEQDNERIKNCIVAVNKSNNPQLNGEFLGKEKDWKHAIDVVTKIVHTGANLPAKK